VIPYRGMLDVPAEVLRYLLRPGGTGRSPRLAAGSCRAATRRFSRRTGSGTAPGSRPWAVTTGPARGRRRAVGAGLGPAAGLGAGTGGRDLVHDPGRQSLRLRPLLRANDQPPASVSRTGVNAATAMRPAATTNSSRSPFSTSNLLGGWRHGIQRLGWQRHASGTEGGRGAFGFYRRRARVRFQSRTIIFFAISYNATPC
jgi:hypothetical protein